MIFIVMALLFTLTDVASAQTAPNDFTVEGRLYDGSGIPLNSNVDVELELLDDSANGAGNSCVFYSETYSGLNVSSTDATAQGVFALRLGSGTTTYPTSGWTSSSMPSLFVNGSTLTGVLDGTSTPCSVTTVATSHRVVRVKVRLTSAGGAYDALTPDTRITSAPTAMVAENANALGGYQASQFLLTNANTYLTQTNVESVFSTSNFTTLMNLLAGTGYISSSPTSAVSFNSQRLTNIGTPTSSSDAATKAYADTSVAGSAVNVSAVGLGVGNGDVLVWNATQAKWVAQAVTGSMTSVTAGSGLIAGTITSVGTLSVDVGTTAFKLLQLNSLAQIPGVDGSLLTNLNTSRLQGRAVSSATPSSGQVLTWNSAMAQWDAENASGGGSTTTLTGDVAGTGTGSIATAIQPNAVTSAKINNNGVAVNRLLITDASTGGTVGYATCVVNQVLQWTASGWACTDVAAMLGNNGVIAGTYGSGTQVAEVSVDATGRVNGLSNVNIAFPVVSVAGRTGAVTLSAGDISGLGTAATQTVGTGPGNVVQLNGSSQLPAVDGGLLANVNAVAIQGHAIASISPLVGQQLVWNGSAWTPVSFGLGDLTMSGGGIGLTVTNTEVVGGSLTVSGGTNLNGGLTISGAALNMGAQNITNVGGTISGSGALSIAASGTSTNLSLTSGSGGSIVMSPNVGIGTTGPAASLDVWGGIDLFGANGISIPTADTSGNSIAIGPGALAGMTTTSTSYGNVALGFQSMGNGTMGTAAIGQTAVGYKSLAAVTIGSLNTAVGYLSLTANSTGNANTAVGYRTLPALTSGGDNTAVGYYALNGLTTGGYNTAIGPGAGSAITTGGYNVVIGAHSGTGFNTVSNNVLISDGGGNARIYVNSSGMVGIGTVTPAAALDVWATGSSISALIVPRDTVGHRPGSPVNGMIRYASDTGVIEGYINSSWQTLTTAGSAVNFTGDITMSGPGVSLTINGSESVSGALSVGSSGLQVTGPTVLAGALTMSGQNIAAVGGSITGQGAMTISAGGNPGNLVLKGGGTGQVLTNSIVGIGTSNATANLDVYGTGAYAWGTPNFDVVIEDSTYGPGLLFRQAGSNYGLIRTTNASLDFFVANAGNPLDAVSIQEGTGFVGIGTPTPASALQVNGVITVPDGNASSPSYSFATDPTSGLYKNTIGGRIDMVYAGSVQGSVVSTGVRSTFANSWYLYQGGTTASNPPYTFVGDTSTGVFHPGAGSIAISTAGTERMRIASNGNLGVGTTGPNGILDVEGGVATTGANGFQIRLASQSGNGTGTSGGNITFLPGAPGGTGGTIGTVGIYQSSSYNNLAGYFNTNEYPLNSTTALNPGVVVFNASGNANGFDLGYGALSSRYRTRIFAPTSEDISFSFHTNGTAPTAQSSFSDAMVIMGSTGNVGIGTTIPGATLDVKGHVANSGTAATIGTCGTSPSISGNDTRGLITLGTGSPTACTITFASAYSTTPHCVVTPVGGDTGAVRWWLTEATGSLILYFSASPTASQQFEYHCMQ